MKTDEENNRHMANLKQCTEIHSVRQVSGPLVLRNGKPALLIWKLGAEDKTKAGGGVGIKMHNSRVKAKPRN